VKKGEQKVVWVFSALADAMAESEADNWETVNQCSGGYVGVDLQAK